MKLLRSVYTLSWAASILSFACVGGFLIDAYVDSGAPQAFIYYMLGIGALAGILAYMTGRAIGNEKSAAYMELSGEPVLPT
jgi:hypothetical protein